MGAWVDVSVSLSYNITVRYTEIISGPDLTAEVLETEPRYWKRRVLEAIRIQKTL